MMRIKTAILMIVLSLVLLGTANAAQLEQAECYSVVPETLSGAGYRLTSLPLEAERAISGGGYQLLIPADPALTGNGCCCVFLPTVYAP